MNQPQQAVTSGEGTLDHNVVQLYVKRNPKAGFTKSRITPAGVELSNEEGSFSPHPHKRLKRMCVSELPLDQPKKEEIERELAWRALKQKCKNGQARQPKTEHMNGRREKPRPFLPPCS